MVAGKHAVALLAHGRTARLIGRVVVGVGRCLPPRQEHCRRAGNTSSSGARPSVCKKSSSLFSAVSSTGPASCPAATRRQRFSSSSTASSRASVQLVPRANSAASNAATAPVRDSLPQPPPRAPRARERSGSAARTAGRGTPQAHPDGPAVRLRSIFIFLSRDHTLFTTSINAVAKSCKICCGIFKQVLTNPQKYGIVYHTFRQCVDGQLVTVPHPAESCRLVQGSRAADRELIPEQTARNHSRALTGAPVTVPGLVGGP